MDHPRTSTRTGVKSLFDLNSSCSGNVKKRTHTKEAYLSKSVKREESRNPLANGLRSILSLVICFRLKKNEKKFKIEINFKRLTMLDEDDFKMKTYQLILIGSDCNEDVFRKYKSTIQFGIQIGDRCVAVLFS